MASFVLNYLNINIPSDAEPIVKFALVVLTFSLIIIFNFITLINSLVIIILIQKYDIINKIKNKFILKYIKLYKKTTIF